MGTVRQSFIFLLKLNINIPYGSGGKINIFNMF